MPALKRTPPIRASGATRRRRAASEPRYWPNALARAPVSVQIEVSRSGAPGARSSQAASTSARALAGYDAKNQAARRSRRARRCTAVTIAKLPPPPRSAQKRSSSPLTRRRSPRRGHDVERGDAVERQAERAAGEPHAAAGREPAERHVRARPGRDREPAPRQPPVELEVAHPGAGGDDLAAAPEAIEAADVDDHGRRRSSTRRCTRCRPSARPAARRAGPPSAPWPARRPCRARARPPAAGSRRSAG